jgi:membrane-associated phospholipid phosphatase
MLRSTLVSGLSTNILKYTIREKRPDSSSKNSFPSGHTTTAFAFASVMGNQHGMYYGGASYLMATFVGLSRINDNKHYLFDVAAGALIGTMYGISITNRETDKKLSYNLFPVLSHDQIALALNINY